MKVFALPYETTWTNMILEYALAEGFKKPRLDVGRSRRPYLQCSMGFPKVDIVCGNSKADSERITCTVARDKAGVHRLKFEWYVNEPVFKRHEKIVVVKPEHIKAFYSDFDAHWKGQDFSKLLDRQNELFAKPWTKQQLFEYKTDADWQAACEHEANECALEIMMWRLEKGTPIRLWNARAKRFENGTFESIRLSRRGHPSDPWFQETLNFEQNGNRFSMAPLHDAAPIGKAKVKTEATQTKVVKTAKAETKPEARTAQTKIAKPEIAAAFKVGDRVKAMDYYGDGYNYKGKIKKALGTGKAVKFVIKFDDGETDTIPVKYIRAVRAAR